jgi:hypothetical protein
MAKLSETNLQRALSREEQVDLKMANKAAIMKILPIRHRFLTF